MIFAFLFLVLLFLFHRLLLLEFNELDELEDDDELEDVLKLEFSPRRCLLVFAIFFLLEYQKSKTVVNPLTQHLYYQKISTFDVRVEARLT